jgi:signal transduction histidine kinase
LYLAPTLINSSPSSRNFGNYIFRCVGNTYVWRGESALRSSRPDRLALPQQAGVRGVFVRRRPVSERALRLEFADRRRIAQELRESTSQELAALKINLGVIRKSGSRLDSKAKKALAECFALAEDCSQEIRVLSHLLHPLLLEEFGLVPALRRCVESLAKKSGLRLRFMTDARVRHLKLPREFETALFLVVQEGLANVRLHSRSETALVELRCRRGSDDVLLRITDHGRGIPDKMMRAIRDGDGASIFGIAGMTERIRGLGGHFTVSTSGEGTVLLATLPLPKKGET